MTQIINLFKTNSNYDNFDNSTKRKINNTFTLPSKDKFSSFTQLEQSNRSKDNWNLGQLQSYLKKGVKKQLDAKLMKQEINIYQKSVLSLFYQKLKFMFLLTFLIIIFIDLNGPIIFTLTIFMLVKVIPYQNFEFNQSPLVKKSLEFIYYLVYCSLVYSLLKWFLNISDKQINSQLMMISVFITLINSVINYYSPLLMLNLRNYIHEGIQNKRKTKLFKIPVFFYKQLMEILRLNLRILYAISFFIAFMAVCMYLLKSQKWSIFTQIPAKFCVIIKVFIFLVFYQSIIDFINFTFTNDLAVMVNKMPIFLNLLRLESRCEYNIKIQKDCTKSLYLKMKESQNYLSTETCKFLIYTTYMDIFNQYGIIKLEQLNSQIMNIIIDINSYDKIINSNQNLINDLFIYFRKINAFIQAEISFLKIYQKIADNQLLFHMIKIARNEATSSSQTISVSYRIIDLIHNLQEKLKTCRQKISLTHFMKLKVDKLIEEINYEQKRVYEKS